MKSEKQFSQSKSGLRAYSKSIRKGISDKQNKDKHIFERLASLDIFKNAKTILCYVSMADEVDTIGIIKYCFDNNKRVATPCCLDNMGKMEFFYINSIDDLKEGYFGVKEPYTEICEKVENFNDSIIVVPGLCFDKKGNRLGYGKGYYDRFLQIHPLNSVGLCYNSLIVDNVPTDKYDKKINYIITDEEIIVV